MPATSGQRAMNNRNCLGAYLGFRWGFAGVLRFVRLSQLIRTFPCRND